MQYTLHVHKYAQTHVSRHICAYTLYIKHIVIMKKGVHYTYHTHTQIFKKQAWLREGCLTFAPKYRFHSCLCQLSGIATVNYLQLNSFSYRNQLLHRPGGQKPEITLSEGLCSNWSPKWRRIFVLPTSGDCLHSALEQVNSCPTSSSHSVFTVSVHRLTPVPHLILTQPSSLCLWTEFSFLQGYQLY